MLEMEQYTCTNCPMGCPLQLTHEGENILEVFDYQCNRGLKYAKQEFSDPRRSLSTTVAISHARWARLPVKVSAPIPKDRVIEAAREIHQLQIESPVKRGQVLMSNFLGEKDIEVVALRSMERIS
ncbi:MAG: DUF1667 domain-containing protein [SAR324 cluster bacterium]|nr:DUF1667 domain-containing protein [SAR324 cluster bacterium]